MDDIRKMLGGNNGGDDDSPAKTLFDMASVRRGADIIANDESVRMVADNTVGYAKLYYDAAIKLGFSVEAAEAMAMVVFEESIAND